MILITRPKAEARKLKNIIESLGQKVHVDSLSEISATKLKKNIKPRGIILISSQRAAKIFIKNYSKSKNLPLLVIGNVSYEKLVSAGFINILHKTKNSDQILKYLKNEYSKLKKYENKITYFTSSVSNNKFIYNMKEIGFQLEKKIIYKTIFRGSFAQSTIKLIKNNKIKICLLYSQQNANHFYQLIQKSKLSKKTKDLLILTMSKNISKLMRKNGFKNVKNSRYPSQESLIKLLRKL